jgi:hypothetical protein
MIMLFGKLLRRIMRRPFAGRRGRRGVWPAKRPLTLEKLETRKLLALLQYTPDNGNDTELIIELNEQGAFGYSDDLAVTDPQNPANNNVNAGEYDPQGTLYDLSGTTFASGIALGFGDYNGERLRPELEFDSVTQRHFVTAGYIGGRGTDNGSGNNLTGRFIDTETDEPNVLVSEFFYPNTARDASEADLRFRLVQTLVPLTTNGEPSGVVLEQTYTIQNITDPPRELNFDIIRYMDADLFSHPPDETDSFPGEDPNNPSYRGNGGGMREQGLQNVKTVYTTFSATDQPPIGDTTLVTLRGNPDESIGIPPRQVDFWELGRGSVYVPHTWPVLPNPYHGYSPDALLGALPPYWKVPHTNLLLPDAEPYDGMLLDKIVQGSSNPIVTAQGTFLANAITNDDPAGVGWPTPITTNPDDGNTTPAVSNDIVDRLDEYDVAMAMRNVYTRLVSNAEVEYYTQTVFGQPPVSPDAYGWVDGSVLEDVDNSGTITPADQPLQGVTVYIDRGPGPTYAADGVFNEYDARALSGRDGSFRLNRVPVGPQDLHLKDTVPDYSVVTTPITVSVPNGGPATPTPIFLMQFDGGYVTGNKFMDLDGSGTFNPSVLPAVGNPEVPLAGWTIYHDANSNFRWDYGEDSDVTDGAGNYSLRVPAGSATIREEVRPNWTPRPAAHNLTVTAGVTLTADFGNEPAHFTVKGLKWEDETRNGVFDSGEVPLAGFTVYIDLDNNSAFDPAIEPSAVTGADGRYTISSSYPIGASTFYIGPGTYVVREVQQGDYVQSFPAGGSYTITAEAGQNVKSINFGNRLRRATVSGLVWEDANAPFGVRNVGDNPLGGIFVYVDYNSDGRRSVTEPAVVTGSNGRYSFSDLRPGAPVSYIVRLDAATAAKQTTPPLPGYVVTLNPGDVLTGRDFGIRADLSDYGDAPTAAQSGFAASYPTTVAQNGAVHEILDGYMLGSLIDGEANGQPTAGADGDDLDFVDNDEDGMRFVTQPIPGRDAQVNIFVKQDGLMANRPVQGFVQMWIDWNQDGDWKDAGEWVIKNFEPQRGDNPIPIRVPAGALLGTTYARVRLGLEPGLGFAGPSLMGEVEDHQVEVVTAAALPDLISRTASGEWRVGRNTGSGFVDEYFDQWVEADGWHDVMVGDFDGDGRDDVIGRDNLGRWQVSLNEAAGVVQKIMGRWNFVVTWQHVTTADFNDDGLPDIIGWNPSNGKWLVARNNPATDRFVNEVWTVWPTAMTDVVVGNFAGGSRLDILGRNDSTGRWFVGQNNEVDPQGRFVTKPFGRWKVTTWSDVSVGNVVATNNYDEVVGQNPTGKWVVGVSDGNRLNNQVWGTWPILGVTWVDVELADFNDDGWADLMALDNTGAWHFAENIHTRFAALTNYGTWHAGSWEDIRYDKFTNDNLLDVVGRRGGNWYLGRNTPTGFVEELWGTWGGPDWQDVDSGLFD